MEKRYWLQGMMTAVGWAFWLLAGCAPTSLLPSVAGWQPEQGEKSFSVQGRLSVKKDGKGFFAGFDWERQNGVETIQIYTPLGNAVGSLCRDSRGVVAQNAAGERFEAADASELSGRLLGLDLPAAYLQTWLFGQWVGRLPHHILPDGTLQQQEWHVRRYLNPQGGVHLLQVAGQRINLRLIVNSMQQPAGKSAGMCATRMQP